MPHSPLFWLALLTFLGWVGSAVEAGLGARRIRDLPALPPVEPERAPRVSVVVAARNEERNVEAALRSLLAQRYPALELLVVDDRSTDRTGEILDRLAAREARLRVVHLTELPAGWLGKNHALQRGAEAAAGEWILFTDADVVFHPTAVERAVGYALSEGYDHVAIAPQLLMPGAVLDLFAGTFSNLFARYSKPWKARDPRSPRHIGVGAFNLVRASAYRAVGGHAPIAMRPDDDLKLGKLLKQNGFRQDVLFGREMLTVEWYASLREVMHGLEKNSFAGLNYSVTLVLLACLALFLFDVFPFLGVFLTHGAARWLNAASALVAMAMFAAGTRASGARALLAPGYPLAVLLLIGIILRATFVTLKNGGIRWRETHYPLRELRANRV